MSGKKVGGKRNPYAVALQKRFGGGVRPHRNKKKYTRKEKHKEKYCE